jgi:4-hydroxy-tetrahydrodipicolinate synthase
MIDQLQGTGVALVTPFDAQGAIDFEGLRRVTEHVIRGGVEYLVLMGTTGESVTLSEDEQLQALETVLAVNDRRRPVLIGAGGNNTRAVADKMRLLDRRFVFEGFLSVSPYYNKPNQRGIYQHYKQLAEATDRPIMLYNVPGRTGSNIQPQTVLALARNCKPIRGIKEASGDLSQGMQLMAYKPSDFLVVSGDDALAVPQIAIGFGGVISVSANARPAEFSNMIRYALAGEIQAARTLQYNLLSLMQLHFAEGNPAGVKASLEAQRICQRTTRAPLAPATDELYEQIEEAIQQLQASPA